MKKTASYFPAALLLGILIALNGCTTKPASLSVARSLPPQRLAHYNDDFSSLREDRWEKSYYTYNQAQMTNFKKADFSIQNRKLKIATRPGGFSKGALQSRFYLHGDFDVQIDCDFNFLKKDVAMDQMVLIAVIEAGKTLKDAHRSWIILSKQSGSHSGRLFAGCRDSSGFHAGINEAAAGFHGTVRFVRIGQRITAMCKKYPGTQWRTFSTCHVSGKDFLVGFTVQNFYRNRTSIRAKASVVATFDNFRINAAQAIVESEI